LENFKLEIYKAKVVTSDFIAIIQEIWRFFGPENKEFPNFCDPKNFSPIEE